MWRRRPTFEIHYQMLSNTVVNLIPLIQSFMAEQPVLRAWLFGSCSRGEEKVTSDIDILVDYDNSKGLVSLFQRGGILMDLSDLLGRKVDIVDNSGLMGFARESVDRDKILIYANI